MKKIIWITGSSTGIGKQLALLYARNGHTVYASARSSDKLKILETGSANAAGKIIAAPLDVTDTDAIRDFLSHLNRQNKIPDLCILNAGFYRPVGLDELTIEDFETTHNVNYMGVVRCLLTALPLVSQRQVVNGHRGHIAIVSSVAGYRGLPRAAAYGSSKAALINLAESLKHECQQRGIVISLINPGFVKTPMTDLNSFGMPFIITAESAAARMYKGLENKQFEITFPRRFTWLMKLLRILPYRLYFFVTKNI